MMQAMERYLLNHMRDQVLIYFLKQSEKINFNKYYNLLKYAVIIYLI